jgi:hypothetical protein
MFVQRKTSNKIIKVYLGIGGIGQSLEAWTLKENDLCLGLFFNHRFHMYITISRTSEVVIILEA